MHTKSPYSNAFWIRIFAAAFLLIFTVFAGCSGEAILDSVFPTDESESTPSPDAVPTTTVATQSTTAATLTVEPTPLPTMDFEITQNEILVWIPEDFSILDDNEAARLLQQQIQDFERKTPGVTVQVRIKAVKGASSIIDSLQNTRIAAPDALPHIVLLPQVDMETAASQQLIVPVEDFIEIGEPEDYFPYAMELSRMHDVTYGFPFVGDAMVGVASAGIDLQAISSWDDIRSINEPLYFPANHPQARLTISQYLSTNIPLANEQGHASITTENMLAVLDELQKNVNRDIFLPDFSSINSSATVWDLLEAGEADLVINWASKALQSEIPGLQIFQIPSLGEEPYTSATGWVWAIVNREMTLQENALDFIAYMGTAQFQADYCQLSGYLPVKMSSLALYEDDGSVNIAQIKNLLPFAHAFPENDLILKLGPILRDATLQVLDGQLTLDDIIASAQGQIEALQTK